MPMGTITLEQFLAMPDDDKPANEYACGGVMQKPMPDLPHMRLQAFFTVLLFQFLARTSLVFAPREEPRTLRRGDTLDGGEVLPGFAVPVDDIFAQLQV